jgi:DNA-binding GntR family transcriptional regulator
VSTLPSTRAKQRSAATRGSRIRGSGAQIVYDTLRKAILELELAPGSPLDEMRLSEQFAMSRTPIREALVRLASEGLVTSLPNRNTIVAPMDFVRLPVYFEALSLMYRVTTRLAASNRNAEDLERIRGFEQSFAKAVALQDALAMISSNREFHVAIAEAGGNPYFTGFFSRLLDEGRRILRLYYSSFGDKLPRKYVEEHKLIVRAIEAGDAELAETLAATHAAQIVRQIQDYIARDGIAGLKL